MIGRSLAIVLAGCGLAATLFVLDAYRPRDGYFESRLGQSLTAAVTELPAPRSFISERVTFASDTGLEVVARILRPESAAVGLRTVVLLGGHETGSQAIELVGEPEGVVFVALDYPYTGSTQLDTTWETLKAAPGIRRALLDTPAAIRLALRWLREQPWSDPQQIELVGVSFGVPFIATAAASEDDLAHLWLIHGAADNLRWLEANVGRWAEGDMARRTLAQFLYWFVYGPSFDTEERVGSVSAPVTIVGARDDRRTPESEVLALFGAASEPKRLRWTAGGHVGPNRPRIIQALLQLVLEG